VDLADYFDTHGYVTVPDLIPDAKIDRLLNSLEAFKKRRLPYFSQTIHNWIRPEVEEHGYMVESMQNFTRLMISAGLREAGNDILLGPEIRDALRRIKPGNNDFVQWLNMLFDRSTGTVDHVDSWYLDTEPRGDLVAAWVALEDIHADAGPFHVYPGRHKMPEMRELEALDHEGFVKRCAELGKGLTPQPALLRKGTVLFWHPFTLHGASSLRDASYSRKSLTSHYLPYGRMKKERDQVVGTPAQAHARLEREFAEMRFIGDHPTRVSHSARTELMFNLHGLARYAKNRIRGTLKVEMDMRRKSYGEL
jgi:phytanoyl-CoA hydroxylase